MPLQPRLPQLPSLGELLEHPRVKGLVARVNRSTIAQRAGGFLEEVRASLRTRTGHAEAPSLAHLAERLAWRLLGEPVTGGPVINATGIVLGGVQLDPPLPEAALHAMVQFAGEYHRAGDEPRRTAEISLCDLFRAEAAFVAGSLEALVALALNATAGGRQFAFVGEASMTDPVDWPRLAARAGSVLATGEGGRRDAPAAIVRAPSAMDADLAAPLESLAEQARRHQAPLIDVAPDAGAIDPGAYGFTRVATVNERIAAGADLVIFDGGGLLGGPRCGIAIGRRAVVQAIAQNSLASLIPADSVRLAGLQATLQHYFDDFDRVVFQTPVWQLLTAPLANLQQRAERLATLMGESPALAATAKQQARPWRRSTGRTCVADTWVVELKPADGDAGALGSRLARGPSSIASEYVAGTVVLDLRSVFPRWDQQLVAAVDAAATRE